MKRELDVTRVFVGGLSYTTKWQQLKEHFAQFGEVEFASVLLKPDGTSKGCGMVNYNDPALALRAVQLLNESMLDGRHIMVKLDVGGDFAPSDRKQPRTALRGSSVPFSLSSPAVRVEGVHLPPEQISRVFVGNLAFSTTWHRLKDHFKTIGEVEFASVLMGPTGVSKGCGMVNFVTHEDAVRATYLNESVLDGRQISVKLDVDGKFRERPLPRPQPIVEEGYTLPAEEICRVFVGSLAFTTNWQALKDHFSQAGEVEFASILLKPDRTSKGCGMVNYNSNADALRAVSLLHDSQLDGRSISVKLDVDGKFKDRPAPGTRLPVHQKAGGIAPMRGASAAQTGHHPGGRGAIQISPTQSPVQLLHTLTQVAQSPMASQVDWPSLINRVAATAATAQQTRGRQHHAMVQNRAIS